MAKRAELRSFARPLRKSARIAQQQSRAAPSQPPGKQTSNHALPSPSTSDPDAVVAAEPTCSSPVGIDASRKRKRNTNHTGVVQRAKKQSRVSRPEEEEVIQDPVGHWATHHVWPTNYNQVMSAKRTKRSNEPDAASSSSRRQSWSEQRKDGLVPEPYGREYETLMPTRAMHMDVSLGRDLVAQSSIQMCKSFQESTLEDITPKLVPKEMLSKVVLACQNYNEARVNRDITPLVIPPVYSLYLGGDQDFDSVCDEVNQPWYDTCNLFGPRPQPDLAVGLLSSAFTAAEHDKLNNYKSVDNWAQFTNHMYFPFLIAEVKCGRTGLDEADRQCMHSASVAVRAICRLEQEADKYRSKKKLSQLNGQILVFSLSHDEKDLRLYGHYAVFQNDEWHYHRYPIKSFNIFLNEWDLMASHNFFHNVLSQHRKSHLALLQDAIGCLPEPTGVSFVMSETSLGEDQTELTTGGDHRRFAKPVKPASALAKEREEGLSRQIEQLLEEQRKDREEQRKEREERRKDKEAADRQILQLQEMLSTALSGRREQN